MIMWHVNGTPAPTDWLDLEPTKVLYDFDGPRIFTCKSRDDLPYLAYQCGEGQNLVRLLIVPLSEDMERGLIHGQVAVRDSLCQPDAWLFDVDDDWKVQKAWKVDVLTLPPNALPESGTLLWPDLRPAGSSSPNNGAPVPREGARQP
jgi:hypothetical protein